MTDEFEAAVAAHIGQDVRDNPLENLLTEVCNEIVRDYFSEDNWRHPACAVGKETLVPYLNTM